MIDIEADVFDGLYTFLGEKAPEAFLSGDTVRAPSDFPCVTLEEADNYAVVATQDSASNENHVSVMYEANIYSNRASERKSECRRIAGLVDQYFAGLGFTRTSMNPIKDSEDRYYRIVLRYTAKVSAGHIIYRR